MIFYRFLENFSGVRGAPPPGTRHAVTPLTSLPLVDLASPPPKKIPAGANELTILFLPPLNYLLVLDLSFQSHLTFSRLPISIALFTGKFKSHTAHIWCTHQFQMSSCSGTIPPPVLSVMRSLMRSLHCSSCHSQLILY